MGRPRKFYVDADQLMLAIERAHREDIAELEAMQGDPRDVTLYARRLNSRLHFLDQDGVRIDFPRFAGKELSRGEQHRYLEAMTSLENAGLVAVRGAKATSIKLTDAGLAHLVAAGLLPPEAQPAERSTVG